MPLGIFLGGVLAHKGLRAPLSVGGVATTLISLASIRFINRIGDDDVATPYLIRLSLSL